MKYVHVPMDVLAKRLRMFPYLRPWINAPIRMPQKIQNGSGWKTLFVGNFKNVVNFWVLSEPYLFCLTDTIRGIFQESDQTRGNKMTCPGMPTNNGVQYFLGSWNLCLGLFHKKDYVRSKLQSYKIDISHRRFKLWVEV